MPLKFAPKGLIDNKCSSTAETGSHLCVSAMTGELSKAPKRWWGNFICTSKMASRFVPSDVSFGDVRHHSVSSVPGVLKAVKHLMRLGTEWPKL